MPRTRVIPTKGKGKKTDYYEIAVRQFQQQILPPGLPGHDRLELWLGQPSRVVPLPRLHDRGQISATGARDVDQRPD